MEFETNIPPKMDIEAENQFSLQRIPSEMSQKHTLHMFCKKFSNFSIEESIIFNWKNFLKPLIFSHDCKRYFEHFAILLVYSKNKLRLYNIRKFYEVTKMNEQPKSHPKNFIAWEVWSNFLVVALAESKVVLNIIFFFNFFFRSPRYLSTTKQIASKLFSCIRLKMLKPTIFSKFRIYN